MPGKKRSPTPTVLPPLTLPKLLNYVVTHTANTQSRTTLVICADRNEFLHQLLNSLCQTSSDSEVAHNFLTPTLHNILTTQRIKLAFCGSVQALLGYLSAYRGNPISSKDDNGGKEPDTLMLVNPLALHASTPSFSAQGLSRTFAAAVEASLRSKCQLVIVECVGTGDAQTRRSEWLGEEEHDVGEDVAVEMTEVGDGADTSEGERDPWEQEVPILNVSARKFGAGSGGRGWAGRTVKVKRVVGRWCRFQHPFKDGDDTGSI